MMCSLEHACVIIEGAMCLHNYLVDYREVTCNHNTSNLERMMFQQDVRDSSATPLQVGNDIVQSIGRPNNQDKDTKIRGKLLRDSLCKASADHDMKRRRKNWSENECSHVLMN